MKLAGKIIMILAGFFLLLHTYITHCHNEELDKQHFEICGSPSTLLDLIRLAFHIDPGQQHLEEFQIEQQIKIQISKHLAFEPLISFRQVQCKELIFLFSSQFYFQIDGYNKFLSFRGPPQLV